MIPQAEGTALIETVVKNDPVQGALVPMNCNKHGGIGDKNQQCLAAVKADRDLVDGLALVRKGRENGWLPHHKFHIILLVLIGWKRESPSVVRQRGAHVRPWYRTAPSWSRPTADNSSTAWQLSGNREG